MVHVVVLAHGSRDPRHAETMRTIAQTLHERSLRASVGVAFLDFCEPALAEAVSAVPQDELVIVVPMLLTTAFHANVDVPAAVASARDARPDLDVRLAAVLGPAPALVAAVDRRIVATGVDTRAPGVGIVVIAAGSSDERARAEVAAVAHEVLDGRLGTHAFASGPGPSVDDAVRGLVTNAVDHVVVAQYVLAPGVLPDRAVEQARATAAEMRVDITVADVIGAAEELFDLIPERARAAAS